MARKEKSHILLRSYKGTCDRLCVRSLLKKQKPSRKGGLMLEINDAQETVCVAVAKETVTIREAHSCMAAFP